MLNLTLSNLLTKGRHHNVNESHTESGPCACNTISVFDLVLVGPEILFGDGGGGEGGVQLGF